MDFFMRITIYPNKYYVTLIKSYISIYGPYSDPKIGENIKDQPINKNFEK